MVRLFGTLATFAVLSSISVAAYVQDWQQRNYNTIRSIYNITIYPHNLEFLTKGVGSLPKGLFAENATGRITPVGNFTGLEDSVEYFFGLTPPPQAPLYDTWTKASIVSFTSGCPEVASSVVYGETTGVNPNASTYGKKISTIKQVAFWRFDDSGAVIAYDAWLPTLASYTAHLYGTPPTPLFQEAAIAQICQEQASVCIGANTQYDSIESCIDTLKNKDFGTFDEAWGDNVVCRSLHVLLAKIRPAAHCVHVGPTGGGKCVQVEYNDVYFDDEALFGAPSGCTFTCPGLTL